MSVMNNDVPDQSQQEQTVLLSHSAVKATCNPVFSISTMGIMDGNCTGGKKMNARVILDQSRAQAPCME